MTVCREVRVKAERVSEGDCVLVSGTLADHGMAVLSVRQEILDII